MFFIIVGVQFDKRLFYFKPVHVELLARGRIRVDFKKTKPVFTVENQYENYFKEISTTKAKSFFKTSISQML
jgi:hypothetical protein